MNKRAGIKGLRSRASGAIRRLRRFVPRGPQPAILMYHRIGTETFDPWGLAVAPERFEAQLQWLARARTILPLTEFAAMHRQANLPGKAVALTFDDAYACNFEVAVPMLERLGIPATIFVPAELIERGQEFWWDDLERMVLEHSVPALRVGAQQVALGEPDAGDRQWPPDAKPRTLRQRSFHLLWSQLREKAPGELLAAMEQLREQTGTPGEPRKSHRPMTAGEVRSTASTTVAIGSHTLTHPSLPRLQRDEKRHEIVDSVARCAALSGATPTSLAYPYGDFDAESERFAADAGFDCACTTEHAFVTRQSRAFALPRMQVGDWSPERLARMLGGA
jgi:peptidoglycan/xylan/chitin deacetylase (PgdA/CDA1 family)